MASLMAGAPRGMLNHTTIVVWFQAAAARERHRWARRASPCATDRAGRGSRRAGRGRGWRRPAVDSELADRDEVGAAARRTVDADAVADHGREVEHVGLVVDAVVRRIHGAAGETGHGNTGAVL